jgi:hypothetical protein
MSTRYAATVSLLLAVALVPTIIHSYVGARTNDGLATKAIDATLAGLESTSTDRRAQWVEEVYGSVDWIERRYTASDGSNVLLFAARSYDLKRLYHHPELGVVRGIDLDKPEAQSLSDLNGDPVHLLHGRKGQGVVAYALLYDGEFVENPIALQLRTSWELIFSARKPMTLFLVYDKQLTPTEPFNTSTAARVLTEAITSFRGQVPRQPAA